MNHQQKNIPRLELVYVMTNASEKNLSMSSISWHPSLDGVSVRARGTNFHTRFEIKIHFLLLNSMLSFKYSAPFMIHLSILNMKIENNESTRMIYSLFCSINFSSCETNHSKTDFCDWSTILCTLYANINILSSFICSQAVTLVSQSTIQLG